jgi:hypothetical protein
MKKNLVLIFSFLLLSINGFAQKKTDFEVQAKVLIKYTGSGLSEVKILKGVKVIEEAAFENHGEITSIIIPNSVEEIKNNAFKGCKNLVSITIPKNVFYIGESFLSGCDNLTTILVDKDNKFYSNGEPGEEGVLYNKGKTVLEHYHASINKNMFRVPDNITKIRRLAFEDSKLASIVFPASLDSIESLAFKGCENLNALEIPKNVIFIGDSIFTGCGKIGRIDVNTANQNYLSQEGVFYNKNKSILIKYPPLKEKTVFLIPNGVEHILADAFLNVKNLSSISLPKTLVDIADNAFAGCDNLKTVEIKKESEFKYPANLFKGIDLSKGKLIVPVERKSFYLGAAVWKDFGIIIDTKENGDFEINEQRNLIKYLGSGGEVRIPEGVIALEDSIFSYNDAVTSIYIPKSVSRITPEIFSFCTNLRSIQVDENNHHYFSQNGVLYNVNKTTLITYPAKKEGKTFSIPGTVKAIEAGAFFYCENLRTIDMPISVEEIGDNAFVLCNNLSYIKIPAKVHKIGAKAFMGCLNMEAIEVQWNNPIKVPVDAFNNIRFSSCQLVVPDSINMWAYQEAAVWNRFKNITSHDAYVEYVRTANFKPDNVIGSLSGKVKEIVETNSSKGKSTKNVYHLNPNGQLTYMEITSPDGSASLIVNYEYHEETGQIVRLISQPSGDVSLIEEISIDQSPYIHTSLGNYTYEYFYDEGKMIKATRKGNDVVEEIKLSDIFENRPYQSNDDITYIGYGYDAKKNWIRRTGKSPDKTVITSRKIVYY